MKVTCTTGVACCVYDNHPSMKVTTLHKWAGLEDGRHSAEEIVNILTQTPYHAETRQRIKSTDVLIIDEASMMSKKIFETLIEVCSIRKPASLCSSMQLILSGDFLQLPPVANSLYNDEGRYCFESSLFSKIIPHRVILTDVIRQSDSHLIKAIHEISNGNVSQETNNFILSLDRNLSHELDEGVKLFSTNDLVNNYNRQAILKFRGDLFEFQSEDTGQYKYLESIVAPKILWAKIGCPVILLRNLSDKLVNGLKGYVVDITPEGPVVQFPTIGITTQLNHVSFSGKLICGSVNERRKPILIFTFFKIY